MNAPSKFFPEATSKASGWKRDKFSLFWKELSATSLSFQGRVPKAFRLWLSRGNWKRPGCFEKPLRARSSRGKILPSGGYNRTGAGHLIQGEILPIGFSGEEIKVICVSVHRSLCLGSVLIKTGCRVDGHFDLHLPFELFGAFFDRNGNRFILACVSIG